MSSRSRMFGGEPPEIEEVPSPRTTIVGGRPPDPGAELPPVPTGIQELLRLATVDGEFRRKLVESRGAVAAAAGITLGPSERAVLQAVPARQLELMIENLPPSAPDRRNFLRGVAGSAVTLLGGAALGTLQTACPIRGATSDVPPAAAPAPAPVAAPDRANQQLSATGGGAAPHPPPPRPGHNESQSEGGISPHAPPPRPQHNETQRLGGTGPSLRRPEGEATRPEHRLRAPGGAAPDVPQPTRGIRPDVPPKKPAATPDAGPGKKR